MHGVNETYKNFEFLFSASMSRYSSYAKSATVSDSILPLMLLHNSAVFNSHRVPILSAAASKKSNSADAKFNDNFTKLFTFESVASVIMQCD